MICNNGVVYKCKPQGVTRDDFLTQREWDYVFGSFYDIIVDVIKDLYDSVDKEVNRKEC